MAGNFGSQTGNNVNNSNGKFSSQTNSSTTPTRTQRIFYKQQGEKQKQEQQQAEMLGSSLWKDVEYKVPEQYVVDYRPKEYSQQEWNSFSDRRKMLIMRSYSQMGIDYYARRGLIVPNTYGTREVTKTREFTNTDYAKFVDSLSPEMKKYFISVPELEKRQQDFRSEQKTKTQTEITNAQQKLKQEEERYRKKIANKEEWWHNQSSKYRDDPKNKQRYMDSLNDYENRLYEEQAYYKNYLEKLNFGVSELDKGKMFDYNAIQSYAKEYGNYKQNIEHARNNEYTYNQSQMRAGLTPIYSQAGTVKGWITPDQKTNLPTYLQGKITSGKYGSGIKESDVKYYQGIADWTKKVGFSKVSNIAQKVINPSAIDWQTKNPTEKLVFDSSGNVQGVESGMLGGKRVSVSEYNDPKTWSDYQVKSWRENTPPNIPFKIIETPLSKYGKMDQTINTNDTGKIIVPLNYAEEVNPKKDIVGNFISSIGDKIKVGEDWLSNRMHWKIVNFKGVPIQRTIVFGTNRTQGDVVIDQASAKLQENIRNKSLSIEENAIGLENYNKFKEQEQQKYQNAFENAYMEKIIKGEITQEEAQKEWEKSDQVKYLDKQYQENLNNLKTGFPAFSKQTLYGFQAVGLNLASAGVEMQRTPYQSIKGGGAIVGGVILAENIPQSLRIALDVGFLTAGVSKIVSKTSTYEQKAIGFIEAIPPAISLTRTTFRYLNSPVINRKEIAMTKANLKTDAYGVEGKSFIAKINGENYRVDQVAFPNQKISQYSIAGSRAEVTTKWRSLLNKYLGTDIDPIYYGVPNSQRGVFYNVEGLGFKTSFSEKSAYQIAKDLLKKYGYTEYQAIKTLRYNAPRFIETYLESGKIYISGKKAVANIKFLIQQPKIEVDYDLGIETRGARAIRQDLTSNREIIGISKDGDFIIGETTGKYTSLVTPEGFSYNKINSNINKIYSVSKEVSLVKGSDLREVLITKNYGGIKVSTPINYQRLDSAFLNQQIIPYSRDVNIGTKKSYLIKNVQDGELEILDFDKLSREIYGYSISKPSPYSVPPANIKKTPFSKTFNENNVERIIEVIKDNKISGVEYKNIATPNAVNRIEDEFYGKGLYERTEGDGVLNLNIANSKDILSYPVNVPSLDIKAYPSVKLRDSNILYSDLKISSLALVTFKINSKIKKDYYSEIKSDLKTDLKSSLLTSMKTDLKSDLKTDLKSDLKTDLKSSLLSSYSPSYSPMIILPLPTYTPTPVVKAKPFFYSDSSSELKKKINKIKIKKKIKEIAGLLPDFTSRAIGLNPQQFGSVKDALREINKIKTGFEVQRGGRIVNEKIKTKIKRSKIKNFGNMDVSLKGIMA